MVMRGIMKKTKTNKLFWFLFKILNRFFLVVRNSQIRFFHDFYSFVRYFSLNISLTFQKSITCSKINHKKNSYKKSKICFFPQKNILFQKSFLVKKSDFSYWNFKNHNLQKWTLFGSTSSKSKVICILLKL